MHPARIAELLAPFLGTLPDNDQRPATKDVLYHNISTYIDILLRWNARINLTAIRDPEEIVTRHFGESLFAARQLFADISGNSAAEFCPDPAAEGRQNAAHRESRESAPSREQVLEERKPASLSTEGDQKSRPPLIFNGHERGEAPDGKLSVADFGSGAGFPGIPFKLWNPRINLTLIESNHKKATFLREVARSLTLTNIDVFNGRAEDFNAAAHAHFDIVTLRAVEQFKDALQISAGLLGSGGRLSLLIGNSQQEAAARILPSFSWSPAIPIPLSRVRILLVGVSPES